jgi:hypothetical protein
MMCHNFDILSFRKKYESFMKIGFTDLETNRGVFYKLWAAGVEHTVQSYGK